MSKKIFKTLSLMLAMLFISGVLPIAAKAENLHNEVPCFSQQDKQSVELAKTSAPEEIINPFVEVTNPTKTTYYAKGNKIVDEYGIHTYDGYRLQYRVIKITPYTTASSLRKSQVKVDVSAKNFKAGTKSLAQFAVDKSISHIPVIGSIYSVFRDVQGIISGFDQNTVIDNASGALLVSARKNLTAVYIKWNGIWTLALKTNSVNVDCSASATCFIKGREYMKTEQGSFSTGSDYYNIHQCCNKVVNGKPRTENTISSITAYSLNQQHTIYIRENNPFALGAKLFPDEIFYGPYLDSTIGEAA